MSLSRWQTMLVESNEGSQEGSFPEDIINRGWWVIRFRGWRQGELWYMILFLFWEFFLLDQLDGCWCHSLRLKDSRSKWALFWIYWERAACRTSKESSYPVENLIYGFESKPEICNEEWAVNERWNRILVEGRMCSEWRIVKMVLSMFTCRWDS